MRADVDGKYLAEKMLAQPVKTEKSVAINVVESTRLERGAAGAGNGDATRALLARIEQ